MNANFNRICGLYGRTLQLLRDARIACQEAYKAHKESVKRYDECLEYANKRTEISINWAKAATAELDYWSKRALAAEAELFTIKNNA